jgi:microcystin-dependent protein
MSLATLNVKDVAAGNDLNTAWGYTFTPIDTVAGSDITLWLTSPAGVETQVMTSYSIDLVNAQVVYPTPASMPPLVPVPTGWTVTVRRTEPFTQLIALTSQGSFDPAVLEKSLDKISAFAQQINDYVNNLIAAGLAGPQAVVFLNNLNALVSQASADAAAANLSAIAAAASEAAAAAFSQVALASQVEAEAGANNVHYMSPLRTLQALSKSGLYMVPIANLPVGNTANKIVQLDGSARLPAVDGSQLTGTLAPLLPYIYPIGCIYASTVATNPSVVFGFGTWVAFAEGEVMVGYKAADADFGTPGASVGAKTVTLNATMIPAHTHLMDYYIVTNHGGTNNIATVMPYSGNFGTSATSSIGGGLAHNNIQPSKVVYYFTRTA